MELPNKKQVLVVDDEPEIIEYISEVLTTVAGKNGISIQSATNGLEAFRLMENQKFDLITLDLRMPVMDGSTVLEARRTKPNLNRDTQTIIFTGFASNLRLEAADNVYIAEKPSTVQRLTNIFRMFLKIPNPNSAGAKSA